MGLINLVRLLKRRIAIILAIPIVFGVATAVVCWGFMPDQYQTEVALYLGAQSETKDASTAEYDKKVAEDALAVAQKEQILDGTAKALQLATLSGYKIDIGLSATNRIMTISVVGRDPESIAIIADELAIQINDSVTAVMGVGTISIGYTAKIPQAPIGPPRIQCTLIAVAIGLVLALIIVALMHLLNMSVRSKKEAEDLLGVPVVGRMPYLKDLE